MTANQTRGNLVKVQLTALLAGVGAYCRSHPAPRAAVLVPNVLINSYSSSYPLREPSHSVNGPGTLDSEDPADNFMTNSNPSANGDIGWTLNGKYSLSSINVYNYREFNSAARSAKDVILYISSDWGKNYSAFSTTTLAQAPATGTNTPTSFNLAGQTVTNVKIHIANAYSNTENYVGLNEVQFNGTAARQTSQATISATAASSFFSGRSFTGATDGVFETIDPSKMWMSNGSADPSPGHAPTITFSLGANPQILDHLNIWNYNEAGQFVSRGVKDFQIEFFNSSMTSLGLAVNDSDGTSTFTLNPSSGKFLDSAGGVQDGNTLAETLGIRNAPSASFFRIETSTNQGDAQYFGLTEVQAFVAPEPASIGLLAIGGMALLRRRRA